MISVLLLAASITLTDPFVIDGDTLRQGRQRYRVENIDAPERGRRAQCPEERALAEASRAYLIEWVAEARRVEAHPTGRRDRYGRVVARIDVDGADLGKRLIARGLAQRWHKADFCSGAWLAQGAR